MRVIWVTPEKWEWFSAHNRSWNDCAVRESCDWVSVGKEWHTVLCCYSAKENVRVQRNFWAESWQCIIEFRRCFLMGNCRPLSSSLQRHQMSLAFGVAWERCRRSGWRFFRKTPPLYHIKACCRDGEACENTPLKGKLLHVSWSDWCRLRVLWLWLCRQTVWFRFTWENLTSCVKAE